MVHGAHFQVRSIDAHDEGIAFAEGINAVENDIGIDLRHDGQAGAGNLHRRAGNGQRDFFLFVQGEDDAVIAAQRSQHIVKVQPGHFVKLRRPFCMRIGHGGDFEQFEMLLDIVPYQRHIKVRERGQDRAFRQQIQFLQRMRRLAEHGPDRAGILAGIMMDNQLAVIKARLAGDGTHAHAADLLDAAVLETGGGKLKTLPMVWF